MVSFPFGDHPRLADYMAWAADQGCTVQTGYTKDADGRPDSMTLIKTADGKRWIIEVGTRQDEFLVPTTIARYDRRLGLESPWFSIDAEPAAETDC